jgi:hypothetical protein
MLPDTTSLMLSIEVKMFSCSVHLRFRPVYCLIISAKFNRGNITKSCLWCYSECATTPRASWKVCLTMHRGNRTRDLWTSILKVAVSIPTVVRQTFQQLARCGCTLRVTPQTSYSPEYITPTHRKSITKRKYNWSVLWKTPSTYMACMLESSSE